VTVRLDHTGQSQADRTKSFDIDRVHVRRGVDRAPDQGDINARVAL
jgi:hypothetical protein